MARVTAEPWAGILAFARAAFLIWYVTTAFRTAYGGTWMRALTTAAFVSFGYAVVVMVGLVAMVLAALTV